MDNGHNHTPSIRGNRRSRSHNRIQGPSEEDNVRNLGNTSNAAAIARTTILPRPSTFTANTSSNDIDTITARPSIPYSVSVTETVSSTETETEDQETLRPPVRNAQQVPASSSSLLPPNPALMQYRDPLDQYTITTTTDGDNEDSDPDYAPSEHSGPDEQELQDEFNNLSDLENVDGEDGEDDDEENGVDAEDYSFYFPSINQRPPYQSRLSTSGNGANTMLEITPEDVESGFVDIQGIRWHGLNLSRAQFRQQRIQTYQNYENLGANHEEIDREIFVSHLRRGHSSQVQQEAITPGSPPPPIPKALNNLWSLTDRTRFFKFKCTRRREKISILHFQLRNLLWATSKNDVFYSSGHSAIRHWCPLTRTARTVLSLEALQLGGIKISTMAAKHELLMVGGFYGEYVLKRLDRGGGSVEGLARENASQSLIDDVLNEENEDDDENDQEGMEGLSEGMGSQISLPRLSSATEMGGVSTMGAPARASHQRRHIRQPYPQTHYQENVHSGAITSDPNGITNQMDIFYNRQGTRQALISSNDQRIRLLDLTTLGMTNEFEFDWAVNCSCVSPDKRMLSVVGDCTESRIVSADSGDVIATLRGHIDFSFATAWSPDGRIIATGNQDKTTRLYDIRNLSKAFVVLGCELGAVRSLRFSGDNKFLAIAEPADFVHLVDVRSSEFDMQTIDFFGEIAGISFAGGGSGGNSYGSWGEEEYGDSGTSLFIGNSDESYGGIIEFERDRSRVKWFDRVVI